MDKLIMAGVKFSYHMVIQSYDWEYTIPQEQVKAEWEASH